MAPPLGTWNVVTNLNNGLDLNSHRCLMQAR